MSALGNRLREVRRARGFTQAQLADKAGTSQAVIQKIENGRSIRPRITNELCAVLDIPESWLLTGTAGPEVSCEAAMEIGHAGRHAAALDLQVTLQEV